MYNISSFELVNQIERVVFQSCRTYNSIYISLYRCYPRHCFLHAEKFSAHSCSYLPFVSALCIISSVVATVIVFMQIRQNLVGHSRILNTNNAIEHHAAGHHRNFGAAPHFGSETISIQWHSDPHQIVEVFSAFEQSQAFTYKPVCFFFVFFFCCIFQSF